MKFDLLNTSKYNNFLVSYLALLGFLRTIYKDYYKKHIKPTLMALLTKPKDLDYEIFIFKKYEGLMKYILA